MTITDLKHDIKAVMHLDADDTQNKRWCKGMLGDKLVGYITTNQQSNIIESQPNPVQHVLSKSITNKDVMILKGCLFNYIECN